VLSDTVGPIPEHNRELGVILCRESEWSAIGMKLRDEHAFGVSRQLETAVGI
jgi:hypothetical protein